MSVTLETLELTQQELDECRQAIRKMAYLNWLDAGMPASGGDEFWLRAERNWIEHHYVPHRGCGSPRCVSGEMRDQQSPGPPRQAQQGASKQPLKIGPK
ncbi:MAG TPA: DUF2934 domain-containing protein [Pirellulales bacterium]|jgi:hypothetical protein|nr:DUF2934 domain-containing protein [Pirellulales bacterium]